MSWKGDIEGRDRCTGVVHHEQVANGSKKAELASGRTAISALVNCSEKNNSQSGMQPSSQPQQLGEGLGRTLTSSVNLMGRGAIFTRAAGRPHPPINNAAQRKQGKERNHEELKERDEGRERKREEERKGK